ncbi:alkaline phosphatase PafA [Christiangramia sabulilitoris]|uniref:Alkaline phosphatase family protein n=1 Tax=Christiangramia sabulilitoris TaxID=2583991 RepID=A0A550I429_9FLAO|nr:alkaline phosphatase PafA [Christiangramia sabulilitoris]TRO65727.1 alkaline phosphatase family protein [Christiangramia sabulilitoris]
MKRLILAFFLLLTLTPASAQLVDEKPKLVVGIVVDQMRYDYLTRFWGQYGQNGFKRLVNNGFVFKNNHFNYVPTYTGPGHASVFTGATPENHGIISNSWYNKFEDKFVYCTGDESFKSVGTSTRAGEMSPNRMLSTTFGDENRLHTQMKGKTIGIALKDRGAILPAGHSANAAYWFVGGSEANWISSTYYIDELPKWVQDFNASEKAESYLKTWAPLKNIDGYIESGNDINEFEGGFNGMETASFPYDLKKLAPQNGQYELIKATPFGNDLTAEFAKAAIKGESLGKDDITDVLTLSFSSTDYVGHNFGVNSKEAQDTYLRLDLAIGDFLTYLDQTVGEGEYLVFLTADHGAVEVPSYLKSKKIPAGYFSDSDLITRLNQQVVREFKAGDLIANVSNGQVFFNYDEILRRNINASELQTKVAHFLLQQDHVSRTFTRDQLQTGSYNEGIASLIENGFNQKRSGDVVYVTEPGFIVYPETGTTHGSGFSYDTHVPLIFFGKGIKKGSTYEYSTIPDIAPTISAMLGISFPNAATGKPLKSVLEK